MANQAQALGEQRKGKSLVKGLRKRLSVFQVGDDQMHQSFIERLAREQGWSLKFARNAFEEYRKFLYLAMTSGHPVTPSKVVYEVWHLHLCYTRSYWNDLCEGVLGYTLHHEPSYR